MNEYLFSIIVSFIIFRTAAQTYMANERSRAESLLKGTHKKKKQLESRQSESTPGQQTGQDSRQQATVSSSSTSDDEERMFQVRREKKIRRKISFSSMIE